jgi:putative membrane protein
MHKTSLTLLVLSLLVLLFAGFATPTIAASDDQEFATEAAQGGLAEVQLGQLAQEKAASQLQQLAKQKGLDLPAQANENQRSEKQKLEDLSGAEFDRQFIQGEIKDHQKDIAMYQQETRSGKNGTLKSFAEKSLPILQKHLQIAQSLAGAK